jgi:hypothetical protein
MGASNVQMGSAEPGWADHLLAPLANRFGPQPPQRLPGVMPLVLWSNLLREDVQIFLFYFSKDFNAHKYF